MKSPPELWAECSDAASLSRHLSGSFGEIRITRLEPETAVAWEGERASGTVKLEPSGWGTKVILTARGGGEAQPRTVEPEPEAVEPEREAVEPEPVAEREPAPADPPVRSGLMARLSRFLKPARPAPASGTIQLSALEPAPAPEPEPTPAPEPEPEHGPQPRAAPAAAGSPLEEALTAALESLGQAHHRPYSRA